MTTKILGWTLLLACAGLVNLSVAAAAEPELVDEVAAATDAASLLETIAVDQVPVPATPSTAVASSNRLIEEVVVTAQKRVERLQDVPISIQAFSQEKLEVLGIQSVQDVQRATPGFTVTTAAAFNIVFLRGVGSDAYLPGVDSSVPFYLDGVPLIGLMGTSNTLGRVERIEVLKGPQGTLFGRNATGGTISIITPDPDNVFSADAKLELGNRNTRNISLYANLPITDDMAVALSGFSNERDNIIKNINRGDYPDFDVFSRGARAKYRWQMLDDLSLTVNATYAQTANNAGIAFQLVYPAPALAGAGLILPADPELDRELNMDGPFGGENKGYSYGFTLDWSLQPFDAKLIAAHQKIWAPRVEGHFDGTSTPVASAHGGPWGDSGAKQFVKQDTVELQFLSSENNPLGENVDWVAGFFYLSSLGGLNPITFAVAEDALAAFLPELGPEIVDPINAILAQVNLPAILGSRGVALANYGLIDSESYSAYAQTTLHMTRTIDLTAGIRYQDEKRKLVNSHTDIQLEDGTNLQLPLPQGGKETLHPQQTSLRAALQWRPFGPDDQIYLSWARAYKSPTYNTVNLLGNLFGTMVPLKAERVSTTELGLKTALFNRALQLNTAVFYTIQQDPLSSNVSIPSGGIANFTNAGEAEIKGFDGDFLLLPMPNRNPGLVITGGYSYLDAIYTEFVNGRGFDDATGLGFGNGGASLPPRDLSGNRIPRVPEWSYQLGVSQRIDFDSGNAVEVGADMFYTSTMYFLPQNSDLSKRDPTTLYNARVTYFYTPWDLELTAFINNITDEIYVDSAFVSDFGTALLANEDPRLYGVRAKLTF